jgi:hypothetical protein
MSQDSARDDLSDRSSEPKLPGVDVLLPNIRMLPYWKRSGWRPGRCTGYRSASARATTSAHLLRDPG